MIEENGGKKWYFDLYKKRNNKIIKGIEKMGLSTFPKQGYESPTVSCINAPIGSSGPDFYRDMRAQGFELAQGYGELREQTFRIGNMGFIKDEDISDMLDAMKNVIDKSSAPII
jgi:aspartate aminotransferase-like enzyme